MHTGKFFSGLPPKMINRSNSCIKNRQESHFYWPDDTKAESAIDTRVRRRASFNHSNIEKPSVNKSQITPTETVDDVDTKQRLHKEFTKSSIQFYDNILEEEEEPRYLRKLHLKQSIASKPTANRLDILEKSISDTDTDTTAQKKKQVFDSKVEFFDFVNEDNFNKRTTQKYDLNNKKHVERNTKNSPKLQIKHNVKNYIRDEYTPEREIKTNDMKLQSIMQNKRATSEFRDDLSENYVRQSRAKSMEPTRRNNIYRRDQTPKRILRNYIRNDDDDDHEYHHYMDEDEFGKDSTTQITKRIQNLRVTNGQRKNNRKQVTYSDREENIPQFNKNDEQDYFDDHDDY